MISRLRYTLSTVLAATVLLACLGCETVETTVLIGERITELPDDWSGTWQLEDEVVYLRAAGGTLHAAHVEWKDGEFTMNKVTALVTRLGEHRFLHIENEPDEDAEEDDGERETTYGFMLIEQPEKNVLLVSGSDAPAFRMAVEAGKLRGEILREAPSQEHPEGSPKTTILRDKQSLDDFIRRTSLDELFNREEPLKLKRIVLRAEEDKASNGN